jgi:hypothetical protein
VAKIEDRLDAEAAEALAETAEQTNEALVRLKDGLWRIRRDRIAGAWAVATLAGPDRQGATLEGLAAIETALSALDRLEVRGRGVLDGVPPLAEGPRAPRGAAGHRRDAHLGLRQAVSAVMAGAAVQRCRVH